MMSEVKMMKDQTDEIKKVFGCFRTRHILLYNVIVFGGKHIEIIYNTSFQTYMIGIYYNEAQLTLS